MPAAIEITSRAIRLAVIEDRRVVQLQTWPVPAGTDPVQAIGGISLPDGVGPLRVLVSGDEVLARVLVQPPCPQDRLDRMVGFELTGGGGDDIPLADWSVIPGFGAGDFRVIALAMKRDLVKRIRQALAVHGVKPAVITHPAVGLYHAWRSAGGAGSALLADVGGATTHLAVVRDDELALIRTLPIGMDALVAQVADLRGLSQAEALKLVTQLRSSSPEELQHLVKRQAGQVAAALTGAVKFAKAQLQIDDWQASAIALAGAGAQVHGFAEAVAERAGLATRPFNPFAGFTSALPLEEMDRQSALPSSWAGVIGAASVAKPVVDVLADERRAKARFWRTDGALRAGVVAAAVLVVAALVLNEMAAASASATIDRLGDAKTGLVIVAEHDTETLNRIDKERKVAADRIAWLDGEHRASRVAAELLSAVSQIQDPDKCPVALSAYRVKRLGSEVSVELEGWAQSTGSLASNDVMREFKRRLLERYPPIAAIDEKPQRIDPDRLRYLLVLSIPDKK